MATISNTPRPGYVWDATDNCWYPIGTGPHSHADYITSSSAINPNIVDAKGDIIAATAADTVARLAVGSNDQVLTADSSTATGLKWASPLPSQTGQSGNYLTTNGTSASWGAISAGGMTLLSTTTLSGATTNITGISGAYNKLLIYVFGVQTGSTNGQLEVRPNSSGTAAHGIGREWRNGTSPTDAQLNNQALLFANNFAMLATSSQNGWCLIIENYASTSQRYKPFNLYGTYYTNTSVDASIIQGGKIDVGASTAISSLLFDHSGDFTAGTVLLYGVK